MASLLDTIRNNSNKTLSTQMQPQVTDETQKAATLLRAKSGKAGGGGAVAQSNLGEQAAATAGATAMATEVAPAAAIQTAAIGQQESAQNQQAQAQQADIKQGMKFNTLQTKMKTDEILNQLSQGNREIDINRDAAALEQVGSNLRLSTQKYTDDLQREGEYARLDQGNRFAVEFAASVLADSGEFADQSRTNASILAGNDREFRDSVSNMDMATAYQMFNSQQAAAANTARWSSAASGVSTAAGAANTYANKPKTETTEA